MDALIRFPAEAVLCAAPADKADILRLLAERYEAVYGLDAVAVLEGLEERERLGSTGFGRGVAIPHARIDGIRRSKIILLRLDEPRDFGSTDGMPVDLVFGLLSPANAGATHLHALAAISRLVRDEDMHRHLVEAPDSEALYALLTNAVDRDAA